MKLGPVKRLVATLARGITKTQMDEILGKSEFDPWDRGLVSSPVDMLVKLRRRHRNHSEFLETCLKLLENVSDAEQLSENRTHL
ncbi:hypothetical protein GBAR_LOCUS5604 [Geodia barretti]|uniref:Uncharacterized protein n=1 Tax=Geodia barretti TaxID=519541 RepID=A0AA35RAZ6_GEOBA|nr:hypothetical protein GBAR_LOCUS5604 [Geodia barretti]